MAVPPFQEMFLPFLQLLSDGRAHKMRDVEKHVADYFNLSPADRQETIPSGKFTKLSNRVGWARTHLKFAGLIEMVTWGEYKITARGSEVAKNPPPRLDLKFLDTIPEHHTWFHAKTTTPQRSAGAIGSEEILDAASTPYERIDAAFKELNETLSSEVRTRLATVDPFRFEQIVLDLLVKMGYGGSKDEAAQVTQRTGDHGIDGVINEDRLGLDVIYVQAKRWQNNIGRPEIQNFVGALAGKKASKGIFITTSDFHDNARDYAAGLHQKVILVDGTRLAELMIEHNIGVAPEQSYVVKKIDSDYFEEA
jgi:restriction system protein